MEYIYIGQYFHYHGKELGITEKKIGRTKNLKSREIQLSKTNSTIGYTYIAAWKVDDNKKIEDILHSLLSATRLDANGKTTEWFEDPDDTLVDSIRKFMTDLDLGVEENLGSDEEEEVNKVRAESKPFAVVYNGIEYQESSAKETLLKVCEGIIDNGDLTEEEMDDSYLFRREPVLNPNNGYDYTVELPNKNWRVFTCIGNSNKTRHLNNLNLSNLIIK